MKLELKHLAIAFTNNWKVTYFDDERELNQVCNIVELREDECTISNGEYEYDVKFDDIKLLCFPISSLTKEITVNGESFVPVKNLFELHHCGMRIKEKLQCFSFNKNKIKYDDFNCAITDGVYMFGYSNYGGFQAIDTDEYKNYTVINQLELLMKLFEWKIDVLGLIEAGLAEPVTEYFNPYK